MIIAVDGPSGSGKSTVARHLAKAAGFRYIDTGAMYRTLAYEALIQKVDLEKPEMLEKFLREIHLKMGEGEELYLNNRLVGDEIRTLEVTGYVSHVSAFPKIRTYLVAFQRECAKGYSVVMDGRDIATVVFPQADLKIFLSADPKIRAERRTKEMNHKGIDISFQQVLEDVLLRDHKDSSRETSPLQKHKEAIEIDTGNLSVSQVVEKILALIKDREGHVCV